MLEEQRAEEVLVPQDPKVNFADFGGFRESGIASEGESDSEDSEDEDEDFLGWGADAETVRLLNVLNRHGTSRVGDEIAV